MQCRCKKCQTEYRKIAAKNCMKKSRSKNVNTFDVA
jgi:hypothetical protein